MEKESTSKMFSIVSFLVDNSTELVPSNWITNCKTQCYFPNTTSVKLLKKLILDQTEPIPGNKMWPVYDAKIEKQVASYEKGIKRLEKFINSNDDRRLDRSSTLQTFIVDDWSTFDKQETEMLREVAGQVDQENEVENLKQGVIKDVPVQKSKAKDLNKKSEAEIVNLIIDKAEMLTRKSLKLQDNCQKLCNYQEELMNNIIELQGLFLFTLKEFSGQMSSLLSKEVKNDVELLTLDEIKAILQIDEFPIKEIHTFETVNALLKEETENANNAMKCWLKMQIMGIRDDKKKIQTCLKHTLDKNVMAQYSGSGRQTIDRIPKKDFSGTGFFKILKDVVGDSMKEEKFKAECGKYLVQASSKAKKTPASSNADKMELIEEPKDPEPQ